MEPALPYQKTQVFRIGFGGLTTGKAPRAVSRSTE